MIQATLEQLITQKLLRKLVLTIAVTGCITLANAQAPVKSTPAPVKTSPGRPVNPVKPASTYSTLQDTGKVIDVREKLVDLAMQNPNYEIADRNVRIANDQLKKAKSSWLGAFSAQGNLNEFSIHPPVSASGQSVNLYPRYNLGVAIPFDFFSSKGNDIKIAKQQLGIAQALKNEKFREIKAEVLSRYEDYLLYKQQLQFQSQIVQDAESVYQQAEKDFSDGIIKQDDYNRSFKARAEEKTRLAEILHAYNISKINLEMLIGVPLDTVLSNQ